MSSLYLSLRLPCSRRFVLIGALGLLLASACGPPTNPTCSSEGDCLAGQECKEGKCQDKTEPPGCKADTDCKAEEACDTASGACKPKPTPGCKADSDCKADETCETASGKCNPKAPGTCKADSDCKADETCENGACKPKPKPECTVDSDCAAGQACKDEKCVNKTADICAKCQPGEFCFNSERCLSKFVSCKFNSDCKSSELCVKLNTQNFCVSKCDPKKNTSQDNPSNSVCWDGWGTCLDISQDLSQGICIPPQSKSRKKGELCRHYNTPEKPEYNDCEVGLECNGTCVDSCDPAKGIATNEKCPVGQYCFGHPTDPNRGICRDLPPRRQGPKKEGEVCSTTIQSIFCDGNSGLTCVSGKCTKACDPRKGTGGSSECGGDDCIETIYSHLGGICLPKATRKEGEDCNSTDKRCVSGFNCAFGKCTKACDSTKPQPGGCDAQKWCHNIYKVCINKCDPAKGKTVNSACLKGDYCKPDGTYSPGICEPLPGYKQGPVQAGGVCSALSDPTKFCDGSKQLLCYTDRCFKTCDFSKGLANNSDCGANENCLEVVASPLGGVCQPQGTVQVGGECNSVDKFCALGLACDSSSRCAKACGINANTGCNSNEVCSFATLDTKTCKTNCDGLQGILPNPSCGKGQYCAENLGRCYYFLPWKQGSRQRSVSCSAALDKSSMYCDGSTGLFCNVTVLKCDKACDPTKGRFNNSECQRFEECLLRPSDSPLGGYCQPGRTIKSEGYECNITIGMCLPGLLCVPFGNKSFCQKECDPQKTGECRTGTMCTKLPNGTLAACIVERKKIRTLYAKCSGPFGTPEYDTCDPQFQCAGTDDDGSYCLARCDPNNPTCASGFVCIGFSNGSEGVCAQSCTAVSDCTSYGTVCGAVSSTLKLCL